MKFTLKQARQLKGYNQEDLANVIEKHVQTYRKLERNPDQLTIGQAEKLCNFLDMDMDLIFFNKDSTLSRESGNSRVS